MQVNDNLDIKSRLTTSDMPLSYIAARQLHTRTTSEAISVSFSRAASTKRIGEDRGGKRRVSIRGHRVRNRERDGEGG